MHISLVFGEANYARLESVKAIASGQGKTNGRLPRVAAANRSHNRPFLRLDYDVSGAACKRALASSLAVRDNADETARAFALLTAAKDSVRRFETPGKTRDQPTCRLQKSALIFVT